MRHRRLALLALAVPVLAATLQPASAATGPAAEPSALAAAPPSLPGSPVCGPSTASPTEPQTGRNDDPSNPRDPSPIYYAPDFPLFADSDINKTLGAVGGFGGIRYRARLHHTPIVFVHGNQADAQNWLDVMEQFAAQAGYDMQEMYALSYNGLGNYYAGAPEQLPPTALDHLYIEQNSNVLANGGHGAGNDDNVPDLCHFVEAVQWYTGSRQVDIVAHSLGVTVARRMMQLYPALAGDVTAFVGIAGGNHGTTVCTGLASSYYGCDEIAPGTDWLARLNAYGETYPPTRWMTVYDGAEGDPFFTGPALEQSPALAGADNQMFNADTTGAPDGHGDYHNDLRVDRPEVETYLAWLLRNGQAGPGAARGVDGLAASIAAQGAADKAQNQQAPQVWSVAAASLCIPELTGSDDGCAVEAGTVDGSGGTTPAGPRRDSGVAGVTGLPNTSAGGAQPGLALPASLAFALAAALAILGRRRRAAQRIPVS